MNKFELFHAAMQKRLYGQLSWVITAFSISTPITEMKPYWIYSSTDAHRYYDPVTEKLEVISDADPTKPAFEWKTTDSQEEVRELLSSTSGS